MTHVGVQVEAQITNGDDGNAWCQVSNNEKVD
jgi:hypothetical protein